MRRLYLSIILLVACIGLQAQTFYICQKGNASTAAELSFGQQGQQVNGLSATAIDSVTIHVPSLRFVGGDVSMLPAYESQSASYYDTNGVPITDLLAWLKSHGWNTIRVRLFVDPSQDNDKAVVQDLEYVKQLASRIKQTGLLFMLDFHYSDTWADPSKQWTPVAWQSLTNDQLYQKIYDYTKDCLIQLNDAGASPDFIQTGNEISYGMLWGKEGTSSNRCYTTADDATWNRFITLLKKAGQACREVCPRAKIIIHSERTPKPSVLTDFFDRMKRAGLDYDIIGLSYYPYFHGDLNVLDTALKALENKKYGKPIQIVETGYPSKWAVQGTTFNYSSTYPYSADGQKNFTTDLIALLRNHPLVDGLSWWYAEANAKGCTGSLSTDWYNAGLFDNETGKALKAIDVLKDFVTP